MVKANHMQPNTLVDAFAYTTVSHAGFSQKITLLTTDDHLPTHVITCRRAGSLGFAAPSNVKLLLRHLHVLHREHAAGKRLILGNIQRSVVVAFTAKSPYILEVELTILELRDRRARFHDRRNAHDLRESLDNQS